MNTLEIILMFAIGVLFTLKFVECKIKNQEPLARIGYIVVAVIFYAIGLYAVFK